MPACAIVPVQFPCIANAMAVSAAIPAMTAKMLRAAVEMGCMVSRFPILVADPQPNRDSNSSSRSREFCDRIRIHAARAGTKSLNQVNNYRQSRGRQAETLRSGAVPRKTAFIRGTCSGPLRRLCGLCVSQTTSVTRSDDAYTASSFSRPPLFLPQLPARPSPSSIPRVHRGPRRRQKTKFSPWFETVRN